jgi:hypothetical protein
MVDASHTFHDKPLDQVKKRNTSFMVYDHKPKGAEKTSSQLNLERRITYDYNNDPVLKLADENRVLPGQKKSSPVERYKSKQSENKQYLKEMKRCNSIEQKI